MTIILKLVLCAGVLWGGAARADDRPTVERAIATSDVEALRAALQRNPAATDITGPEPPLMRAIDRLARAEPSAKARAREVITTLIAAGAPLDRSFQTELGDRTGMPVTWIARIPGERAFVIGLIKEIPPQRRCAVVADIAKDGGEGQWDHAMAALLTIPAGQRRSAACLDLFRHAIRRSDSSTLPVQLAPLFEADMMPAPGEAARILSFLPASPSGRDVASRLLQGVDLAAPLPEETFKSRSDRPASLFAFLLNASFQRSDTPLHANLAVISDWPLILARTPKHEAACSDGNVAAAAFAWRGDDGIGGVTQPADPGAHALLRAATRWLIDHCAPALLRDMGWAPMVSRGSADLAAHALRRGITFANPDAVLNAAIRTGNDEVALAVLRQTPGVPSLEGFFLHLAPPEVPDGREAQVKILAALLARGADPNIETAGARPLAIAALFDRDDLVSVLRQAGAASEAPKTEESGFWLAHRLRRVAGFATPLPDGDNKPAPWRADMREVHLNDDGKPDYIVWEEGCSSVNCALAVLHRTDERWRVVLRSAGDIQVLASRHHGWADLLVSERASAADSMAMIYHFDGDRYQPARCEYSSYDGAGDVPVMRRQPCHP